MIRSRSLALALAASVALSACNNEPSAPQTSEALGAVYPDEASCLQSYTAEECREYKLVAEREHVATAPKYADVSSCERAQGAGHCQSMKRSDGSSVIVPALAGFVIGAAIGHAMAPKPQPLYYGPSRDCPPGQTGQNCRSLYSGSGYVGRATPPAPGILSAPLRVQTTQSSPPTVRFAPPVVSPATGPKIPQTAPVPAPAAAAPKPVQMVPAAPQTPPAGSVVGINPPARPAAPAAPVASERPTSPVYPTSVPAPTARVPAPPPPPPPAPKPAPSPAAAPRPAASTPRATFAPVPAFRPTVTVRGR